MNDFRRYLDILNEANKKVPFTGLTQAAAERSKTVEATLRLTPNEVQALYNLLLEAAMTMDDDGRDGAFDASPLKAIYEKVKALRGSSR